MLLQHLHLKYMVATLSMTGNRIVNLAPGIDGTDGVNIDQLKAARTKSYIQ